MRSIYREYPCDHYTSVINVTLLMTGCPRVDVYTTAVQLLQVLDKRFFGNVGPLQNEGDRGKLFFSLQPPSPTLSVHSLYSNRLVSLVYFVFSSFLSLPFKGHPLIFYIFFSSHRIFLFVFSRKCAKYPLI